MKKLINTILLTAALAMVFTACEQETINDTTDDTNAISEEVLVQIKKLGFSTEGVQKEEDHYIVEGDIILHESDLDRGNLYEHFLRIAETEQYRTTNLVTGLPRTITVSISNRLPSSYVAALDEALARYNAENLSLSFQRVSSNADIELTRGNGSYLASAGFPTSSGDPHNSILVNSRAIGNNPNQSYLATILAHEIGHCIGFRHTDYMDRRFSCGDNPRIPNPEDEGAGSIGAILIPGTPSGPDPNSWMLACIGSGANRPFNSNDRTALNFLY